VTSAEIQRVAAGTRKYISRQTLESFIETNTHASVAYRYQRRAESDLVPRRRLS